MDKTVSPSPFTPRPSHVKLRPYPAYQDSGVPWLGEVPAHWEVRRAKMVFRGIDKRSETGKEELLSVSENDGVIPRSLKKVTMFKAESYVGHKLCWPGDLVINSLWAWKQGLGFSRYHGLVSTAYGVYRPKPTYSSHWRFFDYLLRSKVYAWEFRVRSKGVWLSRLKLTDDDFLDMSIVIPPADEAEHIAAFLTHIDRVTRRYIRAQQRLIELLQEQKRALIQQAVTRGLDPDAPLKDSGIDWLGEIPSHWETWQIGYLAKVGNGSTPSRGKVAYWLNGDYPWLNSSSVNQGVITESDQFVTPLALQECHLPIVSPNSVLVAITGQGKTRGTAALLKIEATINQHIAFITPKEDLLSPEYLQLFLTGAYKQLRAISESSGSTKGALTCGDLKHFKVAIPPRSEQDELFCATRESVLRIDDVIANTQRRIDLIREYRTRLIADVVTGKLDVRGAPLPAAVPDDDLDDLEDDEALEDFDAMEFQEEDDE